ncbi:hypothetical protein Ahia01_000496300 [Argonauta hians]
MIIAEAIVPIVIHFESRVKLHEVALAEANEFACDVLSAAGSQSRPYVKDCVKPMERKRSRRFLAGAILGAIGAGAGIAALSEVKGLKEAMQSEMGNIKAALHGTGTALHNIGNQAHIITSAVRDLDTKVNEYHEQTRMAFQAAAASQRLFARSLNETIMTLKKQVVQGIKTAAKHSRVQDAIVVTRFRYHIRV